MIGSSRDWTQKDQSPTPNLADAVNSECCRRGGKGWGVRVGKMEMGIAIGENSRGTLFIWSDFIYAVFWLCVCV